MSSETEIFNDVYLSNVKKVLKKGQSYIKSLSKENSVHVIIRIEDMKELINYCNELGIMDKIVLRDIEDKDRIIETEINNNNDAFILEDVV